MSDGLGGFYNAYNTMANNRRADREMTQKEIEWAMKNKLADQTWEDQQELRGLGATIQQGKPVEIDVPDPQQMPTYNRNIELTNNAGDFLRSAMDERATNPLPGPSPVNQQAPRDVVDLEQGLGMSPKPREVQQVPMPPINSSIQGLAATTQPPPNMGAAAVPGLQGQIAQPPTMKKMENMAYTPAEQADMYAKTLLKQGNIKGAMEATNTILDISEAVPKHALGVMRNALSFLQSEVTQGATPDEAKAAVTQFAAQNGFPKEFMTMMQSPMTTVAPGGVITQTQPNGDKIINTLQADGTVKTTFEKHTTTKDSVKLNTPLFDTKLGNKALEHYYSFHDTGRYTAQQLFDEWQRMGGTKEAAVKLQQMTGGLKYEKGESYTPSAAMIIDRSRPLLQLPPGYSQSNKDGTIYKQSIVNGKQVRVPITDPAELEALGVTAADYGAGKNVVKSAALAEQTVNTAVANLHGQMESLRRWQPPGLNAPFRALNIPANWLVSKAIGSGNMNAFHAYNQEMAAEIAKIAEGSTGSVKAAAEGLQNEWRKILNTDLPWGEYQKLLGHLEDLGQIRLKAQKEGLQRAREGVPGVGGGRGNAGGGLTIVNTGKDKSGRKVNKMSDGSIQYAD